MVYALFRVPTTSLVVAGGICLGLAVIAVALLAVALRREEKTYQGWNGPGT